MRKRKENEESERGVKPVFELMVDQVECADVMVLNKCDLVSEAELAQVERLDQWICGQNGPAMTLGGPRPVKFVAADGVARDFGQALFRLCQPCLVHLCRRRIKFRQYVLCQNQLLSRRE